MIKHVVMWKFKNGHEEQMMFFLMSLMALKGQIPQIRKMEVGVNVNKKNNFDAILISEFDTIDDLEIYKSHPSHQAVSGYCKSIRSSREAIDYIV